jgi:peptide/nickel transport system substrate-binding protein
MRRVVSSLLGVLLTAVLFLPVPPAMSQAPRSGGVLRVMLREDLPQGFAVHETATISTVFPSAPCFSNLVMFDPAKPVESPETIVGELAERWSWQDNARSLVFTLRKGVTWHDGQPFTSKDVKYTFDLVREAPDAAGKLRLNPRKDWYANIEAIDAPDPATVTFRLKRAQPSLLMMLASGYSPIYPAHVPAAELRSHCVGTGPFKLKEWKRGEFVEYVRNPDYFVKGRPYLDGLRYIVIEERGTRTAALQAGQLDAAFPGEGTKAIGEQLKAKVPQMAITIVANNANDNLLINVTRPPFNNPKVRVALSRAIDRQGFVRAVAQGSGVAGTALLPKPWGVWGLAGKELEALPGYGKPAQEKDDAKKMLAEAGFGPSKPLRVEVATRAIAVYLDFASFVMDQLKQIGVEGALKQVETAQWHPMITRREYQVAANVTGLGIDDPDANFYENYACGSSRNYSGYCNEELMKLIDSQSQESDPARRRTVVAQIQARLEEDAPRPVMGWRLDHYAQWPHVKGLVPHNGLYNWGRMQDVWLSR